MPVTVEDHLANFNVGGKMNTWRFFVHGENGRYLCGGFGYNSKAAAIKGLKAAHKEMTLWLANQKKKLPHKPKKATTARQKPAGMRST